MRVVLDTNILVSACLKPDGREARVLQLGLTGNYTICVSRAILDEYGEVLSRKKFANVRGAADPLLSALTAQAEKTEAPVLAGAASDPDDNRFLECAAAVRADFLVTGNLKHFPATQWGTARIVNARQFLDSWFG